MQPHCHRRSPPATAKDSSRSFQPRKLSTGASVATRSLTISRRTEGTAGIDHREPGFTMGPGFYMRHLSSTGWGWEDDAMTLWLAWIDPISARVSHWSAGPFQNTPEGIADADKCIAAYTISEYPGLCRVL